MIIGYNNLIATKPFKTKEIKVQIQHGFGVIQKETLMELEVVFGDGNSINPGDLIYVHQESVKHTWALAEIQFGNEVIILVPKDMIKLVKQTTPEGYKDPLRYDKSQ